MSSGQVVVRRVEGRLGRLTLNRPEALNALSLEMIRLVRGSLEQWESSGEVEAVLLDGSGDRAFCAGGDIRVVFDALDPERPDCRAAELLWREQHELNALIADFQLPVISVLDGLVLGGGVGIGCHARHRLATQRTVLGMPEVAIGLAPDVGALHIAATGPGRLGDHMALTATRVGPRTAVAAGYADRVVDRSRVSDLVRDLARGTDVEEALHKLVDGSGDIALPEELCDLETSWIESCYGPADLLEVIDRLRARTEPLARAAARSLEDAAPVAAAVTARSIADIRSRDLDLFTVLRDDLRRNVHFSHHPDLREGIRAAVVDKDRSPRWSSPGELHAEQLDAYSAPFDGPDLDVAGIRARRVGTATEDTQGKVVG